MWHRNPAVEGLLTEIGMTYEYRHNVPIKSLKLRESLENNARFGSALDEARVSKYSFEMKAGKSFPAPVVSQQGLILAGNQRINAAVNAGRTAIDAYVIVKSAQSQVDDFIRRDNTLHGKELTDDEKIQTCVEQHRKHGMAITKLNDMYFGGDGKSYQKIVSANQAKDVEERLLQKNVVTTQLSESTLTALHPLRENINTLRDTAQLALDFKLNTSEMDGVVKAIREKDTEEDRKAIIAEFRSTQVRRTRTGTVAPEASLKRQLGIFLKFLNSGHNGKPFPAIETLVKDKETAKELAETANAIIDGLKLLKRK